MNHNGRDEEMNTDFDRIIDRRNTASLKWDYLKQVFGPDVPEDTLPMWVADMDFSASGEILDELRRRVDHGILGYSFADGRLRETAAAYIERHYHWPVRKDWICFSPGVVPALSTLILAMTKEGDEVITLTPVYGPFYRVVEDHGRRLVACPLKMDGLHASIDFDLLERKVSGKSKILLLCSPHNPSGRVWTKEELSKLGEFACRHDLLIASDEIHADFVYPGSELISLASMDPRFAERSLTCYAPSKTFNIAGLGASAVVIPQEELRQTFAAMLKKLQLSVHLFGYAGMQAAWEKGDGWLLDLMKYLEANRDFAVEAINRDCPGILAAAPESTFLLWLDCRELMRRKNLQNAEELSRFFIREAHVALNRGTDFGPEGEGYARLNFGCPRQTLEEAIRRISAACRA